MKAEGREKHLVAPFWRHALVSRAGAGTECSVARPCCSYSTMREVGIDTTGWDIARTSFGGKMSHVSNERVRTALAQAGLSATELAVQLDVDPKTVERWINPGRRPYQKKAHQAAALLGRDPEWLWPGLGQVKGKDHSEVLAVYPERAAVPRDTWIRLLQ